MAADAQTSVAAFKSRILEEWERKTLLDYLRTEIDRIDSDSSRPGWTVWALYAAMAAISAYAFSVLEVAKHHWNTVGIIFIAATVAIDCAHVISNAIRRNRPDPESFRRFVLISDQATESRLFALAVLLRAATLYVVYLFTDFPVGLVHKTALILFLSLNIIFTILLLLFSLCHLPTPKSTRTKPWWIGALLLLLWLGAGITATFGIVRGIDQTTTSLQDYQLAASLCALSFVLIFLSKSKQEPALLDDLRGVERRLALGQLSVDGARRKADRLLHGMTLGDVMGACIQKALSELDKLEAELDEFNEALALLAKTIGDPRAEMTKEQMTIATGLLRGLEAKTDLVKKQQSVCASSCSAMKLPAQMVWRMCPDIADDLASLLNQVQRATGPVEAAISKSLEGLKELRASLKA